MKQRFCITATAYDKKGRVICSSVNDYNKTHPYQKHLSVISNMSEERISLHAEVACLIKAKSMRKQVHTLKVERYGKGGEMRLSFPCPSCQNGIKLAGVRKVIFSSEDGWKTWFV